MVFGIFIFKFGYFNEKSHKSTFSDMKLSKTITPKLKLIIYSERAKSDLSVNMIKYIMLFDYLVIIKLHAGVSYYYMLNYLAKFCALPVKEATKI